MNDSELDHLLELAHGYIEGSLGSAQLAELEALLMENPEARRIYLDFLHDHAVLHWDRVADGIEDPALTSFVRLGAVPLALDGSGRGRARGPPRLSRAPVRIGSGHLCPDEGNRICAMESGSLPTVEGSRLGAVNSNWCGVSPRSPSIPAPR